MITDATPVNTLTPEQHDGVIKWQPFPPCWPFVRGPTGHWWIPLTNASDAELWCFLWSVPEQTLEQLIETPVIWDAFALIMTPLQWKWLPCSRRRVPMHFLKIFFFTFVLLISLKFFFPMVSICHHVLKWCCGTIILINKCLSARQALFVSYSMPLVNTPQKRCIIDFDYSCPFPATVVVKQSPFFPIHVCCSANVNRKNGDCLRLQFMIIFSFE